MASCQLAPGHQKAELLIRRALDGRTMHQLPLDLKAKTHELSVSDWPKGTYFATLLVDDVTTVTRRVVVK